MSIPLERRGQPVGIALAAHFAVADNVDSRQFLIGEGDDRCVILRLGKKRRRHTPKLLRTNARRQTALQLFAINQPVGLRIAAHDGRRKDGQMHGRKILASRHERDDL